MTMLANVQQAAITLRAWLRPHRGISQEHLPCYLGFSEFVYHARRRGKALLDSLVELLPA
jgi:transposase-like protein